MSEEDEIKKLIDSLTEQLSQKWRDEIFSKLRGSPSSTPETSLSYADIQQTLRKLSSPRFVTLMVVSQKGLDTMKERFPEDLVQLEVPEGHPLRWSLFGVVVVMSKDVPDDGYIIYTPVS